VEFPSGALILSKILAIYGKNKTRLERERLARDIHPLYLTLASLSAMKKKFVITLTPRPNDIELFAIAINKCS
jgi:hypothetical protein